MKNKTTKFIAQFKRELIENKWSLVYTPVIVSLVCIVSMAVFIYYWLFVMRTPLETDLTLNNLALDAMYANCSMIMTLYFLLGINYLTGCLYDDRKNKQILFWRSMPVSETFNVLTKVSIVALFIPVMMLLINLFIAFFSTILGAIYLSSLDASQYITFPEWGSSHVVLVPFRVLVDNLFGMFFIFPFIGYFLLMSALVKRFPLVISIVIPILIGYIDFLLGRIDLTIGVLDLCKDYYVFWLDIAPTFALRQPYEFVLQHLHALLLCLVIGGGMIAASIWLRNNRYET
jgi:ABC-2 type transport system permease protein